MKRGDKVRFIGRKRLHVVRRLRWDLTGWSVMLRGPNDAKPRKKQFGDWYNTEEFEL